VIAKAKTTGIPVVFSALAPAGKRRFVTIWQVILLVRRKCILETGEEVVPDVQA